MTTLSWFTAARESLYIMMENVVLLLKVIEFRTNCQIKIQLFDARFSEENTHTHTHTTSKQSSVRMELGCFINFLKGSILPWESSTLLAIMLYYREIRYCEIQPVLKAEKGKVTLVYFINEQIKAKAQLHSDTIRIRISLSYFPISCSFGLNIKWKFCSVFKFWIFFLFYTLVY